MKKSTSLFVIAALSANIAAADTHSVFGLFETEDTASHIQIDDCGDGTPCGVITWIDPASIEDGIAPEALLTRSGEKVLGLQILQGFKRKKKDWRGGAIYDPGENKSYSACLKRNVDGSLQVKGCIGPICQTQTWAAVITEPD